MDASPTPPEPNAAQVPMTEEFDSFKHTMPNALPVVVAILLVAVVLGILAYLLRAKPVVTGSIDEAFAVTLPEQHQSLAVVNLSFRNVTDEPLRLININIAVHANGAEFNDDFATVADFPRYFQALPALQQHTRSGLLRDSKLAPAQAASGSAIVSFPLTQQEFDARDSLTATITFAGHPPVKITSEKKP
jgi:hypothetical protein